MKLTPSSSACRKTFFAFSRSGGQPQIPSPVNRIAPKKSRLTKRSPPNKNVSSLVLACLAVAKRRWGLAAAISFDTPPVKTPAAPAEITPKNVLRLIAGKICCRYQLSTLNYQLALISLSDLRIRWEWDPLRNDPRFQKILAGPQPKTLRDNAQ